MRRLAVFALLFTVVSGAPAGDPAPDASASLSLPPASLAQWYKPLNKRQVWLHTMFKLRRAAQATEEYAELGDRTRTEKWARQLAENYIRIPEMVPEWADEVEHEWAERLVRSAEQGDFADVRKALRKLGTTCKSCHREYRPVVAALFRSPDYSEVEVPDGTTGAMLTYPDAMKRLSVSLNRVKIALDDDLVEVALDESKRLVGGVDDLGASCPECHRDAGSRERILGPDTRATLHELQASIRDRDIKASNRKLGEAAVTICARCHSIHRTLGDLRMQIRSAAD